MRLRTLAQWLASALMVLVAGAGALAQDAEPTANPGTNPDAEEHTNRKANQIEVRSGTPPRGSFPPEGYYTRSRPTSITPQQGGAATSSRRKPPPETNIQTAARKLLHQHAAE